MPMETTIATISMEIMQIPTGTATAVYGRRLDREQRGIRGQ